jgi:hypothetical protein
MSIDIKLGQAKNQATEVLCSLNIDSNEEIFFKYYKPLVKRFFKINNEIDKEVINELNSEKETKVTNEQKSISDKQQYCPGCKKPIPKTWKSHKIQFGGCGWGEC